MKLNQLYYLTAVHKHQNNLSKTAEAIHVTQPCLSTALKSLEAELNITLFQKDGKKITLTEEGELCIAYANQIFSNIHSLKQQINNIQNSRDALKIIVSPTIGGNFLSKLFYHFKKLYPDTVFQIHTEFSPEASIKVEQGEYELAITNFHSGFPYNLSLSTIPLYQREVCFVTYEGHPLCTKEFITPEMLNNEPIALPLLGSQDNPAGTIINFFNNTPFYPDIILYHPQITFITQLISSRFCSSILFGDLLDDKSDLHRISLKPQRLRDVGIVYKSETKLSQQSAKFIDFCQNHLSELKPLYNRGE